MKRQKQRIDEALLIALACGSTLENAAKTLNVSSRTVQRRMADPEFRERLADMKSDMVGRAAAMMTAGSLESAKILMSLQKADQPPTVRLGSARTIIELAVKLRNTVDLEKRLKQLEEQMLGTSES